jgi:predicted nucleotidyltransferase
MALSEIDRILVDFFEADRHGAAAVYLFGSTARGTARDGSDIDLGILFVEPPAATLEAQPYDLEAALERRLGRRVEVVVMNQAPVDLRSRVLREGRLLFDGDRSARIAFEVRTRNEAFDLEPILRRYRAPHGAAR